MQRGAGYGEQEFQVRQKKPFILSQFLYNAEKGTVLDRDSTSWGELVDIFFRYNFDFKF